MFKAVYGFLFCGENFVTEVHFQQFDNTLNAEAAGQVGPIHVSTSKNYNDIKSSSFTQVLSCVIYREMC